MKTEPKHFTIVLPDKSSYTLVAAQVKYDNAGNTLKVYGDKEKLIAQFAAWVCWYEGFGLGKGE